LIQLIPSLTNLAHSLIIIDIASIGFDILAYADIAYEGKALLALETYSVPGGGEAGIGVIDAVGRGEGEAVETLGAFLGGGFAVYCAQAFSLFVEDSEVVNSAALGILFLAYFIG
jgi:hypothetical protein